MVGEEVQQAYMSGWYEIELPVEPIEVEEVTLEGVKFESHVLKDAKNVWKGIKDAANWIEANSLKPEEDLDLIY